MGHVIRVAMTFFPIFQPIVFYSPLCSRVAGEYSGIHPYYIKLLEMYFKKSDKNALMYEIKKEILYVHDTYQERFCDHDHDNKRRLKIFSFVRCIFSDQEWTKKHFETISIMLLSKMNIFNFVYKKIYPTHFFIMQIS